jgi:hypothetical protein
VCTLGLEGIVLKRRGSRYESGRSRHWIKMKNPSPAVRREAEEDGPLNGRHQPAARLLFVFGLGLAE